MIHDANEWLTQGAFNRDNEIKQFSSVFFFIFSSVYLCFCLFFDINRLKSCIRTKHDKSVRWMNINPKYFCIQTEMTIDLFHWWRLTKTVMTAMTTYGDVNDSNVDDDYDDGTETETKTFFFHFVFHWFYSSAQCT